MALSFQAMDNPLSTEDPLSERDNMTLGQFKLWSKDALKTFLAVRDRSLNGTFEELAARYN